jgi:hypothetical protein
MAECLHCGRKFQPRRRGHVFCSSFCRRRGERWDRPTSADREQVARLFDPSRDPEERVRDDDWHPPPTRPRVLRGGRWTGARRSGIGVGGTRTCSRGGPEGMSNPSEPPERRLPSLCTQARFGRQARRARPTRSGSRLGSWTRQRDLASITPRLAAGVPSRSGSGGDDPSSWRRGTGPPHPQPLRLQPVDTVKCGGGRPGRRGGRGVGRVEGSLPPDVVGWVHSDSKRALEPYAWLTRCPEHPPD